DKSAAPTPAIHRLANLVVRLRAARFGVIAAVRLRPSGSGETSRRSALGTPARGGGWSGRRGSNPRPTAWKAVTLPLSYSRLRARFEPPRRFGEASPPSAFAAGPAARFGATSRASESSLSIQLHLAAPLMACQPKLACWPRERRLAREGFEPSKPLGRQIYSLLRLTASLPRRRCVFGMRCFRITLKTAWRSIIWSWRRDLNPRPADYKSAALPD